MRVTLLLTALSLSVLFVSCDSSDTEASIVGRWRLQKEERRPAVGEPVEYANQPTYVILHLDTNGYFLLYDTFIDPNWKSKNLPLIADRSKGQWELNGQELKLNHQTNDTSYTEVLKISEVSSTTLVTEGQDHKSNVFKTYGR